MGISPVTLSHFIKFYKDGIFSNVKSIFEIGSQEVTCAGFEDSLSELLKVFGISDVVPEKLASLANGGSGRELYEMMRLTYACIDTDGKFGSLPLDLNFDDVPEELHNRHDFVTNFGTTEHIVNQLNCFKVIHDLTKPGGFIYHEIPFSVLGTHGLFNYTPKFFWMLCKSNFYEYNFMWIHADQEKKFLHPDIIQMASFSMTKETFSYQDSLICCLVRKVFDIPFVPPWDGDFAGASEEVRKRYWTLTEKDAYEKVARAQERANKEA